MKQLRIKHFDYLIALAGYFAIAFAILAGTLFSPGTIGFFHDWFIGPFPEMNEFWANNGLYIWDSQLGHKLYGTDWIFRLTLLPFHSLGGELLSKGLLTLIMTLSGFGAYCLGRHLKLNPYVSFAAGILYIFSPIVFTRVVAGYLYYAIAYLLSPLLVLCFLKGKQENNYRYFIIAGLLLSFAVIQLQFLILILVILLIISLVDFKRIKKSMIGLFLVISITFLITFSPILLPQLVVKKSEVPFVPSQLLSYFTVVTASDLAKSFRLLGYEGVPYSYLNLGTSNDLLPSNLGIIPQWIFYLDFLIPIVGFSVLLFRRDKYSITFAVIAVVGLFLLKGQNPPFPGIFAFLFIHGFYIFREVWHIAFLYSFSITFLIALFIEKVQQLKLKRVYTVSISVALISIIVLSNGYPLLLGNFAGYMQTYNLSRDYHMLYNKLLSDPHYNVLILPYVNPIRYDNLRLEGVDPLTAYTPNMIFISELANRGSPTLGASMWLLSSIQENKTQNLGNLLSGFGIKYIILRKDFVSNYPNYTPLGLVPNFKEKWYTQLEPILNAQKDMKIIADTNQYKIYENLNNATKIFAPTTSGGGLSDFDSLLWISNVTSLSNVALYPSISDNDSIIFLDDKDEKNMTVNDFVEIGKYTGSLDAGKGWTDNRVSFGYDHLLTSRVNEGAFTTSPNSELSFELSSKYGNKPVEIWLKGLLWEQGGTINIQVNGEVNQVSLFSPDRSFRLFKVFEGESDIPHSISIQNIQGMNYIEGFYIKEKNSQQLNASDKIVLTSNMVDKKRNNLIGNSDFSVINNQSRLPVYWNDSFNVCTKVYNCEANFTVGWNDNVSLALSTSNNVKNTWSSIIGSEISVTSREQIQLLNHMKLNQWATQSHVVLEGYNETSKQWGQITHCPSAVNGPLEWQEFSCVITVPENTTKIREVLNAGWSSQPNGEATTLFDSFNLWKKKDMNQSTNIAQIKKLVMPEILGNKSSSSLTTPTTIIKEYDKINPTLWNVSISTSKPTTIGFAEPYDQAWEASVYKDGKKIEVVNSLPLYGVLNAFQIKNTGDLNIVLDFVPQFWYQIGLLISGLTFSFCIIYIIYEWRRDKKIKSSPSDVIKQV